MLRTSQELAGKYARVLFNLARGEKLQSKVEEDLSFIVELLQNNETLKTFLENPCIPKSSRKEAMENILKKNVDKMSLDFSLLLVEKKLEYLLPFVAKSFSALLYREEGIIEVKITTAHILSDAEYQNISSRLGSAFKKQVVLEKNVDEKILGGLIVQVDDKLIDGSVLNKLKSYENLLHHINAENKEFIEAG